MESPDPSDKGYNQLMSPFIFASAQTIGAHTTQEDSLGTWADGQNRVLLVVADGLGGLPKGDLASKAAVDTFLEKARLNFPPTPKAINNLMHEVNQAVIKTGGATTLCAAIIDQSELTVVNIGDSRAYLWQEQKLRQITIDHRLFPGSNILTRCLGTQAQARADLFPEKLKAGDLLLLCTDGLTDVLSDEEVAKTLRVGSGPEEIAHQLIEETLQRGASDNVSLIVSLKKSS